MGGGKRYILQAMVCNINLAYRVFGTNDGSGSQCSVVVVRVNPTMFI